MEYQVKELGQRDSYKLDIVINTIMLGSAGN